MIFKYIFFTRTSAQNKYVNKILWKKVFKSQMKTNCQKMLQIINIGCCTLSPDLLPCFMVMCMFWSCVITSHHFTSPRKNFAIRFYTYSTLADLCCQKTPQLWLCLCLEQFSARALRNSLKKISWVWLSGKIMDFREKGNLAMMKALGQRSGR